SVQDQRVSDGESRLPAGTAPSERALGHGPSELDGLEAAIPPHDLVGTELIKPLSFGAPSALVVLEDSGGQAAGRELVERVGLETNADQGKQAACLPVASPKNLVVPLRLVPPHAFERIKALKRGHESSLQPFPLAAERLARRVHVQVFEKQAK